MTSTPSMRAGHARDAGSPMALTAARTVAVLGALLCLGVAYIHVADQGGYSPAQWFPGSKDPHYIALGYYALEAAGVIGAAVLLTRHRLAWLFALGIGVGPLVGFVLTRTTGLPQSTDDIGNWGEPLAIASLIAEPTLILLAISQLARRRS